MIDPKGRKFTKYAGRRAYICLTHATAGNGKDILAISLHLIVRIRVGDIVHIHTDDLPITAVSDMIADHVRLLRMIVKGLTHLTEKTFRCLQSSVLCMPDLLKRMVVAWKETKRLQMDGIHPDRVLLPFYISSNGVLYIPITKLVISDVLCRNNWMFGEDGRSARNGIPVQIIPGEIEVFVAHPFAQDFDGI